MVGACTPAAALTARVDTASRPPWASSSAAAARMRSRGRSAVRSTTFMLMMITEFCYHLIVSDANINIVISDTTRWRAILIIVTGANGQLGRAIVEQLLGRIPAEQIGVSVRDPEKAQGLAERGVRVRPGDFADAPSLAHAFEGASEVLIVSSGTTGGTAVSQHRTAIDAAKAAGAGRILYTSHMGANPSSPFSPMADHAATEAALRESGVAFTSLRNGFYATTTLWLLGAALQTGELVAPEDGPVSWTAHADLAQAAAIALTQENLDGITSALTGSEAIDMAGAAAIAAEVSGRRLGGDRHGGRRWDRRGAARRPDPAGGRAGVRIPGGPDRPGSPRAGRGHADGAVRREPAGRFRRGRPDAGSPDRPTADVPAGRLGSGGPGRPGDTGPPVAG